MSETLPLFLHKPVSDSITRALPLVAEKKIFSTHFVDLSEKLLHVLIEARPCLFLITVLDHSSAREACHWLNKLKNIRIQRGENTRDSSLRLILLLESQEIPIERWQPHGVHEYIFTPIQPKALVNKLAHHSYKSLYAQPVLNDTDEGNEIRVQSFEKKPVQKKYFIKNKSVENLSPSFFELEPNLVTPGGFMGNSLRDELILKGSVYISTQVFNGAGVNWVRNSNYNGFEEQWVCELPQTDSKSAKVSFVYTGDRPHYHPENKTWNFSGENPQLLMCEDGVETEKIIGSNKLIQKGIYVKETGFFKAAEVKLDIYEGLKEINPEELKQYKKNLSLISESCIELKRKKDLEQKPTQLKERFFKIFHSDEKKHFSNFEGLPQGSNEIKNLKSHSTGQKIELEEDEKEKTEERSSFINKNNRRLQSLEDPPEHKNRITSTETKKFPIRDSQHEKDNNSLPSESKLNQKTPDEDEKSILTKLESVKKSELKNKNIPEEKEELLKQGNSNENQEHASLLMDQKNKKSEKNTHSTQAGLSSEDPSVLKKSRENVKSEEHATEGKQKDSKNVQVAQGGKPSIGFFNLNNNEKTDHTLIRVRSGKGKGSSMSVQGGDEVLIPNKKRTTYVDEAISPEEVAHSHSMEFKKKKSSSLGASIVTFEKENEQELKKDGFLKKLYLLVKKYLSK